MCLTHILCFGRCRLSCTIWFKEFSVLGHIGDIRKRRHRADLIAAVAVILVLVIIMAAAYLLSGLGASNASEGLNADIYAHLSNATFTLVSPYGVYGRNQRFAELAGRTYKFAYSNATDFGKVKNSSFIVIVVNSTNSTYADLALEAVNASVLASAMDNTSGVILNSSDVWTHGQTVFILAGYKSQNTLSAALLSFFVKQPVYAPKSVAGTFVSFNGIARSSNSIGANDPVMDAYLGGTYELGPHDTSLHYPYSYYDSFAYLLYYAPVLYSYAPGFDGNSSSGLPMDALLCIPPPPPPDGSSLCIGDYVAMPMMQIGSQAPAKPQWSFDTGDCNFFGISDCIDAEGWAASGLNPQLSYRNIPSVYYGFTATGSSVPPSMTGTTGPVYSYLPFTWWTYGPGSVGESTAGFQASVSDQQEISLLKNAGVEMFSAPTGETPLGSFTVYNATNSSSTYSCSSNLCGMQFNYSIYALMTVSSTIPNSVTVDAPYGYSQAPYSNYTAVLEPTTLTTPKIVKTSARTYYFSYWSVYSELDGNQYYQQFNTSNATLRVIGPTQAQAVYTSTSSPGKVTIYSEYMTVGNYESCPPPLKCGNVPVVPVSNVSVSLSSMSGSIVYSNMTGSNGTVTTQTLPAACYQLTAHKNGYNFIIGPNPICLNGNEGVSAVDINLFVFNISWPAEYHYGEAPQDSSIPLNLTLLYAGGKGFRAGNIAMHATAGSGKITGPAATSGNGTADFVWSTGSKSGIYDINFTTYGPFTPAETYSMPVVVYSGNHTSNTTTTTVTSSTTTYTTTIGSGTAYGALNITVFYNGAPAGGADVSAFSPGKQTYSGWHTGSDGEYSSGYVITPGTYEVDATYNNITNSTNYLNVTGGAVTDVVISIYGTAASTTSSSTSSTSLSTTSTTAQSGYYECGACNMLRIAGYSCPASCPNAISCSYGGFECT